MASIAGSSTLSTVPFSEMPQLLVSFRQQNVRMGASKWLFRKRHRMRFEWFALLALKRVSPGRSQGWVSSIEVGQLPSWAGRSRKNITTNIGRYLQALEKAGLDVVYAESKWTGPYRLNIDTLSIVFDIPHSEVKKHLRVRTARLRSQGDEVLRFTFAYAHAQRLLFRGQLIRPPDRSRDDSAYDRFMTLANDRTLSPHLRLVARLGAVQTLFRIPQFSAARRLLLQNLGLLRRVQDKALKAQFHLALAWSYQRARSGAASDRAVLAAISTASGLAEVSGDRAALGLVAHRMGGFLTKKGLHTGAIEQMLQALEAALITGNYEMVQACCGNLGSVTHRLGSTSYPTARRWLLTGISVARWMKIGLDDAHSEMILGKIYIESRKPVLARLWLRRATKIAARAGNQLNRADIDMIWGFWHREFGTRSDAKDALISALRTFRNLKTFDCPQKESYMARSFPDIWLEVLESLEP